MKHLQRLSAALALTFVLTLPAFADGQMPTGPGVTTPPPSTSSSVMTEGDMDCPITPSDTPDESVGDSITGVVWGLLEGVLVLF